MINVADHFEGFAAKKLAAVDLNKLVSHQHEFNGAREFRELLGTPEGKVVYPTMFAYVDDEQEVPVLLETTVTWYDTRRNVSTRGPEYRLYYPVDAEPVVTQAVVGDTMLLALRHDGTLLLVLARQGSTVLRQLEWLFNFSPEFSRLFVDAGMNDQPEVSELTSESVLSLLGIPLPSADENLTETLIAAFPGEKWPETDEFSAFARAHFGDSDPVGDPDGTLAAWVDHEHRLFRSLEKYKISDGIGRGFLGEFGDVDVDAFIYMGLSAANRRKVRAGLGLELHMEAILRANKIRFAKKVKTEGKKEPDFLFPSKNAYHDELFPSQLLTMLGSKTTLKDRWRQVINEANRVEQKHLLTLQAPISEDQTNEMQEEKIQLVIPRQYHAAGFSERQQSWLLGVADFLELVREREHLMETVSY